MGIIRVIEKGMKEGSTLIRVQRLVPHEDGIHKKFEEAFVAVPSEMYEAGLKEKRGSKTHDLYCFFFKQGYLEAHYRMIDYIQNIVGRIDTASIERINPHTIEQRIKR